MIAVLFIAFVLALGTPALAQTPANVAVVINESSAASVRIGEYYAQKRQIPADNIIRLKTASEETISRAAYSSEIETPIAKALTAHALQDRVLYIVLTKGVPLRIIGTAGRNGTGASVDSELTLLYRRMTGRPVPPGGPIDNPYYLDAADVASAKPFTHREHDIFLVTRLDAFKVEDALALVDRALAPSTEGTIVLDGRGDPAAAIGDRWMTEAAKGIKSRTPDRTVLTDQSAEAVRTEQRIVAYSSWGSTDAAQRRRRLGLDFAAGAIAAMLTSSDARTFASPPDDWVPGEPTSRASVFAGSAQSLVGDLIQDGVTGVSGYVAEPYLESAVRPQILFPAYLAGFNLAEAFFLASPSIGWQSVVIGDPLCRPFTGVSATLGEIEEPLEATTGLPSRFVERSVASLQADKPGASRIALLNVIAARARLLTGQRTEAKAAFKQAVTLLPDDAALQLQLAALHEEDGESAEAMAGYRRVVELQPRNVIALNNLAFALTTRGQNLDEASRFAQRAAEIAPHDPNVLDTVGWIEHLRGNYQDAATRLREAARRAPENAGIRLHAAFALAKAGASAEALKQLEAALESDASLQAREDVRELQRRLTGR